MDGWIVDWMESAIPGKTKIGYLYDILIFASFGEQQISEGQISMDDLTL